MKTIASAAVTLAVTSGAAVAACAPSDFTVERFSATVYDDCSLSPCPALRLLGVIENHCAKPAGALVKIDALDAAGNLLDTAEGWPASIRNIAPGATYSFDHGPLMPYRDGMSTFTVEVIDARTWR